jgi:hypothetical protein
MRTMESSKRATVISLPLPTKKTRTLASLRTTQRRT